MKYGYFIIFVFLTFSWCGCQKHSEKEESDQNCKKIQQVKIVTDKTDFTIGDEIHFKINEQPDIALFIWTHGNNPNEIGGLEYLDIYDAEKSDEGWYYLSVSYSDCETHVDSIYVSVKNKLVTAPCTHSNNSVTFSSIPDIDPATVSWSFNSSYNRRVLAARRGSGYPDLNIYFNTYWDTKEPEDGEYSIASMSATNDYPPYTVYISSLYSTILFQAGAGKVYVSHVNGKLSVTFCDIPLTGSSYTTTASGMLTAP